MDPRLTSIQPGGGVVRRIEEAWGRWRRWYLRSLRPRYVARMLRTRRGDFNGCPHEVLDPRDLKFYRNQGGYYWDRADDPFTWRDRLPFARVGLAELIVLGGGSFLLAILLFALAARVSTPRTLGVVLVLAAIALVVIGALIAWFFRNPPRDVPATPGVVISPADGAVVAIDEVADEEFVDAPAVRIGIFLSIFDVHVNRMPLAARVIGLAYRPGKMLNALRPQAARENERLTLHLETAEPPHRRLVVRQITGAIARRIVCWLKPGDELASGEEFGMIKLGSRAELVLPREGGLEILVQKGDKVRAGSTIVARYPASPAAAPVPRGAAPGGRP
jgi:phosphatidylserine decarboxylase